MYERYGHADWDTHPPDPDGPPTAPDPADVRVRPTTKCLVVRDGRALCIGWPNGDWSLPGGGVEPDESVHAAAEREVREEVGLEVRATELLDVYSYFLAPGEGGNEAGIERDLAFVVRCEERERRPVDTTRDPSAVEEIVDHEWVPLAEVGERVVGRALGDALARHVEDA